MEYTRQQIKDGYKKLRKGKVPNSVHKKRIFNLKDIRDVFVMSKVNLSAQSYGSVIESWIKNHLCLANPPNAESGDASSENINIEIKISIDRKFNIRQIRPHHNIHAYILAWFNPDSMKENLFFIPSKDVYDAILEYGGYTHGTKKAKGTLKEEMQKCLSKQGDSEFSLTLQDSTNTKCYPLLQEWREKFSVEKMSDYTTKIEELKSVS